MSTPLHVFSLTDICRAKTIPVEIKDNDGNVDGVVYLKEPSALAALKLREKLISKSSTDGGEVVLPPDNTQFMYDVLALTLSDESGRSLVNSPADQEKLKEMPMRVLFAVQDPAMKMILGGAEKKVEVSGDGEDIDQTLANLDDQVAKTYSPHNNDEEDATTAAAPVIAIPVDGNENLHLDQDPADSSMADPANPFVEPTEVPNSPA